MRLAISPLDPQTHDRRAFSCGKPSIDRYFREVAAQAGRHLHAQTYVLTVFDEPAVLKTVLGFYTLAPHEYRDDEMDPTTARALKLNNLKRIPTVLLGHLAVGTAFQRRGYGPMLLDHAFRKALFASCTVGGALIVTDPIDEDAERFYKKFDFATLPNGQHRLFLAMKTLAKAYPEVVAAARASIA